MEIRSPATADVHHLLIPGFEQFSCQDLLRYFQHRSQGRYFPLSKGSAKHVAAAEGILANEFTFNKETHRFGQTIQWRQNPSRDLEWLILLHKFYYFKELSGAYAYTGDERYALKWVSLIDSWIEQVNDGFIDSQVTGRRLQQWLLSYQTFVVLGRSRSIRPAFFERFLESIHSQCRYLCAHLTPEGNHRTLELYAIFLVAVTFPEFQSSACFLDFSIEAMVDNMRQDLLPDGVHRELSTDYHHTVLKNYLRFVGLARLNGIQVPTACLKRLQKALEFSCYVHKPDGSIPAINDGDCNNYLPLLTKALADFPSEPIRYVVSQGRQGTPPLERSRVFSDSGYAIMRSEWTGTPYEEARYLFFDCASLGFGSHGHYDALGFEMAAFGHDLIVDPGRYTYNENSGDGCNWRRYFKSTAAHNTVVVDGLDQMPYRSGRPQEPEPEVSMRCFVSASGFDYIHGQVVSHRYPVVHQRKILFAVPEYWIVSDLLTGEGRHDYDQYFHLPCRALDRIHLFTEASCHIVVSPNLIMAWPSDEGIEIALDNGYVSPEYGVKEAAPVVRASKQKSGNDTFQSVLYPFKKVPPVIRVSRIPVYRHGRLCDAVTASALLIEISTSKQMYRDYFFIRHDSDESECSFGDIVYSGRFLLLRQDRSGTVISLQGDEVMQLRLASRCLVKRISRKLLLSSLNQELIVSSGQESCRIPLADLSRLNDRISTWIGSGL